MNGEGSDTGNKICSNTPEKVPRLTLWIVGIWKRGIFLTQSAKLYSLFTTRLSEAETKPSTCIHLNTGNITPHHNRLTLLFPGSPRWAGARRELLDFMVQGKINRGRHTNHPDERHSIHCPPPPSPIFYRPDALPATQPTLSKHWRQLAHSD